MSKEYCIARHDDKICFLPNCRYHIILIGNIEELLQKLDSSVSATNTWTVCIRLSSTASAAKFWSRADNSLINCRGQFISSTKTEERTDCPASLKRESWGKGTKNICWALSKRPNQRKLVNQSLQTELNKLKRPNSSLNW